MAERSDDEANGEVVQTDPNDMREEIMMVLAAISTAYDNIGQHGDPNLQVAFAVRLMSAIGFNMRRSFRFKDDGTAFRSALCDALCHGFDESAKEEEPDGEEGGAG